MKTKLLLLTLAAFLLLSSSLHSQQLIHEWTHMNPVKIWDMEFMPDHNTFLVTTEFELQIRSTETGEIIETYPFGSRELEFTSDSTKLISYFRDTLFIRNLDDFSLINRYIIPPNEEEWRFHFHGLQVDPVRPYIYVIREAEEKLGIEPKFTFRRILMFNYETLEFEADLTPEGFEKELCEKIAISKDGKYLAAVSEGKSKIIIFDLDTREAIQELQICPYDLPWDDHGNPTCVKFSQLDNDKIYISGIFPQGSGSPHYVGLIIYSIIENKIVDTNFNGINHGYFDFFDNERRMIYTNGFSLFILNLEQMIIDLTDDADAITMGIMYSNKKNLFIGKSSQSVSKLVYEINSNINNQNDTTQKVYPNPTKDKIFINLEDKFEYSWQLFNFEGKLLIESKELNQKEVDLTNYPNGIYLLHLQYDGQEKTIKIVKEG
jgi:hypothetical protein